MRFMHSVNRICTVIDNKKAYHGVGTKFVKLSFLSEGIGTLT